MAWHYVRDNSTQGPVELTELHRLRQQGAIQAETPVWTDGMTDWVPYEKSAAAGSPVTTSGGVAVAAHPCVECGKSFPESDMLSYEDQWVCASCKPFFFQRVKEGVPMPGTFNYASVGRRFVAIFVDGLVLFVAFLLLNVVAGMVISKLAGETPSQITLIILLYIFDIAVGACYEIFLHRKIRRDAWENGPQGQGRDARRRPGLLWKIGRALFRQRY